MGKTKKSLKRQQPDSLTSDEEEEQKQDVEVASDSEEEVKQSSKKQNKDKKEKKGKKQVSKKEDESDLSSSDDDSDDDNKGSISKQINNFYNEDEITEFFNEIKANIVEIKLPRYQDSGRCRGYAHVTLNSQKAVDKALAMTGQSIKGRYLDIKEAEGQRSSLSKDQVRQIAESMPDDCKTLFVKGLPYEFREDDIGDRFRKFGEIKSIRLSYNWQTKQFKGFAYLTFANHQSAKKALLEMNGKEVKGRQIKVDLCIDYDVVQEPKQGYKVNLNNEKNKLYNKEVVKEELKKRHRKEKDKSESSKPKKSII